VGCGRSEYESRVDSGLNGARIQQTFSVVSPAATEFPGTPLTVRLPKFINASCKAYTEDSAGPDGQGKANPLHVQPPFLKLSGLRITYEMSDALPDSPLPITYYCYLAAVPAGALAADGKPVEESIQAQLAAGLNVQPQWETMLCPTEAGPKVEWRKISATGQQPFFEQGEATKNFPGVFELYTKEIDELRVFIGWRWPQKLDANVSGVAPLVAGSVVAPASAAGPPAAAD
jgi:hypothetical protein